MSLSLEQVTKVVGQDIHIHPLNLSLTAGSLNVLLGPTLAGKTTLMRLMAGLDQPNSGRIFWKDQDVTGLPVQKRNVAMVYQQFINYPSLSIYENIASPLKLRGLSKQTIRERVQEVAELLKLEPLLARKPLELSGGQQQRCALARALAKEAELVLLDEPLANLDYKLREELREELPRIFMESGAVFVYATTEPTEALLLGGHTLTLSEGALTQFAPTLEVYRQPRDIKTAQVFSDPPMNFIALRKTGMQWQWSDQADIQSQPHIIDHKRLHRLADGPYQVGFRPNHALLERPTPQALKFEAQVNVVELTGSESFIHLQHRHERWVSLVQGIHDLPVGSTIPVYVQPENLYVFDTEGQRVASPQLACS